MHKTVLPPLLPLPPTPSLSVSLCLYDASIQRQRGLSSLIMDPLLNHVLVALFQTGSLTSEGQTADRVQKPFQIILNLFLLAYSAEHSLTLSVSQICADS